MTEKKNPQVAEEQTIAEKPGAEKEPQASEIDSSVEPGEKETLAAETSTEKVIPKVYTEEEVAKRTAELAAKHDSEIAKFQEQAARTRMQQEIQTLYAQEQQEQAKDKRAVEEGTLSESEAQSRLQTRQQYAQTLQIHRAQVQQGEMLGRLTMAFDLGTKYGINPETLIKDPSIKTPLDMTTKVLELALKNKDDALRRVSARSEVFDKGEAGSSSKSTSADKIIRLYGEGDSSISRTDYEKAMKQKGLL